MVRAPCCEKMGLKKGPWTHEEDQILINYIKLYGHGNWRALPKQAGLLRCGKSCRLRWTNYLRPDIKRGNFTREEEDTIIKLQEMLGNRWSAIAARLPGRTDNEIKNVWHTHLKKRLKQNHNHQYQSKKQQEQEQEVTPVNHVMVIRSSYNTTDQLYRPVLSPEQQQSSCDMSPVSVTSSVDNNNNNNNNKSSGNGNVSMKTETPTENVFEIGDDFWSEVLSADNSSVENDFSAVGADTPSKMEPPSTSVNGLSSNNLYHSMGFWFNLFNIAGHPTELPEI